MHQINYQISRNGQTIGTYDLEALRAAVQSGRVLLTDFAWAPGMPEWKAVSIIVAGAPMPPSQTPPFPASGSVPSPKTSEG